MPNITEEIWRLKYDDGDAASKLGKLTTLLNDVKRAQQQQQDQFQRGVITGREYSRTLELLAADQKALEKAIGQVGATAGGAGAAGMKGFGGAVFQFSNLMEDAQFGVRGLQNNIGGLIATVGGYSPIALAAAGAGQILVGVFRDQIDGALAAAGVLDENLVKSMDKAKESTDAFTEAQQKLLATMPNVTLKVKDQVQSLTDLAKQLEGTQAKELIKEGILEQTNYRGNDLAAAGKKVEEIGAKYAETKAAADKTGDPGLAREANRLGEALRVAQGEYGAIGADRQAFAEKSFAMRVAAAGSSDAAANQLAGQLRDLGAAKGNDDLTNLANAITRSTAEFKTMEAELKANSERRKESDKLGKDWAEMYAATLRQDEDEKRRGARRAQDQAFADRERQQGEIFGGVDKAMGGQIDAMLKRGVSPEDAANTVFGGLVGGGMAPGDAFGQAVELVKAAQERAKQGAVEVGAAMNAWLDAEAQRNQELIRVFGQANGQTRRMMQHMRFNARMGDDPWLNNRPGWP